MLDGMAKTHGERGESSLPNGSGLLDYAEDMLGGLWKGLMDAKVQVEAIMESSGLTGLIDRVRGFTEEYMNAPGDYIRGKGEYFGSNVVNGVRNVWDGVKGFGERTDNFLGGRGFASEQEIRDDYQHTAGRGLLAALEPTKGDVTPSTPAEIKAAEERMKSKGFFGQVIDKITDVLGLDDAVTQASKHFIEIKDKDGKVIGGETVVNGIKFVFSGTGTTKESIANSDSQLWENMSNAAKQSDVDGIRVTGLIHDRNNAHFEGRGMDVTEFFVTDEDGNQHKIPAYRNYNTETKEWNDVSPEVLDVNQRFTENFMDQDNSIKSLSFDRIIDTTSEEPAYNNIINDTKYSDVGGVGNRSDRTEGFNKYTTDNFYKKTEADKLWRSYQHTSHTHYEVRGSRRK